MFKVSISFIYSIDGERDFHDLSVDLYSTKKVHID